MKEPVVVIDKIINAIGAAMLFFMIGLSARIALAMVRSCICV